MSWQNDDDVDDNHNREHPPGKPSKTITCDDNNNNNNNNNCDFIIMNESCYQLRTTRATAKCYQHHKLPHSTTPPFSILKLCTFLVCYLIVTLCHVHFTQAAPQSSCILCDNQDRQTTETDNASYEEFLFEHQVSRQDAIQALRVFNESYKAGHPKDNSCKSVTCTKQVMRYCLSPQFINDHCWCEMGHTEEGLPYVPHICYVGEKVHKASVGSCFFYEEVKECCCAVALAKQWRHISGGINIQPLPMICVLAGVLLARLPHWWSTQHFLGQ